MLMTSAPSHAEADEMVSVLALPGPLMIMSHGGSPASFSAAAAASVASRVSVSYSLPSHF